MARFIEHDIRRRFPAGAVLRAELLRNDEVPGELIVRVYIPETEDLTTWAVMHREKMDEFRHALSLRLPSAKLLEFTSDAPGASVIALPDDGSLAGQQLTGREIVTKALELLRANYVFPETAEQAAVAVEARLQAGEYDNLDEIALTELLTGHLAEVCHDKHLRVRLGGGPGPGGARAEPDEPPDYETRLARARKAGRLINFLISKVERLDGNVGYLDLRGFPPPEVAGPAVTAAMELVAGTFALIFDLRHNHGGSPDGVVFWCSYLFAEKTQAQGRAEIIGETTGGGAHPTRGFPISPAVHIGIPDARSVNPVTGTNWEGTGVVPDIPVPAGQAHDVAYVRALRHVLDLDEVPPPVRDEAREALAKLSV